MANTDSSSKTKSQKKWTGKDTDFFSLRLSETSAIFTALISNIGEYKADDGKAKDEAIYLATQFIFDTLVELENLSYDFLNEKINLSLYLQWARALMEINDGMFFSNGMQINLSDDVLVNYLSAVDRLLGRAMEEVEKIQTQLYPKAA